MITLDEIRNYTKSFNGTFEEVPFDYLASEVVGIIKQLSGEVQAPTNFTFGNVVAAISAAIGRKVRILDSSYCNRPNLFLANIGGSGSGKSPARTIIKKPLGEIEREWYEKFVDERKKWKKLTTDQQKDNKRPVRERIMLDNSDTSMEAFMVTLDENRMNHNKNGILLNLDELTDFFPNLSRYSGREGNPLAKFLLLYNCEDIAIDRLMRDEQYIIEPICTIVGGIQPDRLKMVFGGDHGSGFVPRWLFLQANKSGEWKQPNQVYHDYWANIVNFAVEMPEIALYFSAEAEKLLRYNHEQRKKQNEVLQNRDKRLGEYIIKQNYSVRRLAGIIHVLNALAVKKEVTREISVDEYKYAETLVDFFVKSYVIFDWLLTDKMPLLPKNLTREETLVQLFRHEPDLNVSALAKALNCDRSNIYRAKRVYMASKSIEENARAMTFFNALKEEFPLIYKIAGGEISEDTMELLISSSGGNMECLYENLTKLERFPNLETYNQKTLWEDAWPLCLTTF